MAKRILLADDHGSVRQLMRTLITQREDLQVCAEAADGVEAVEKAKSTLPDVVVIDLAMGGLNGVDAAEEIHARCPATMVLAISLHDAEPFFPRLRTIGVNAFVPKDSLGTDLLPAIDAVLNGRKWFPSERSRLAS